MWRDTRFIISAFGVSFLVLMAGLTGCPGDDTGVEFDCTTHEECLDDEACLADSCAEAPAEGDSCPEEHHGEEYEEIRCEDGEWERFEYPQAPSIQQVSAEPPTVDPQQLIELSVEVDAGAAEDELDYQWSAPEGWELAHDADPQVNLIAHEDWGETATISIEVTDRYDQSDTGEVTVSTHEVDGPEIESLEPEPAEAVPGETTTVGADVEHPQNLEVDYDWTVSGEEWEKDREEGDTLELVAPDEHDVSASVELTVTDTEGKQATTSTTITTMANPGPTVELEADEVVLEPTSSTEVSADAGHQLDYEIDAYDWSIQGEGWTYQQTGDDHVISLDAPDEHESEAEVVVEVTDEKGAETEASLISYTEPEDNTPPTIEDIYVDENPVDVEGSTQVHVEAVDEYDLEYEWSMASTEDWTIDPIDDGSTTDLEAPDEPQSKVELVVDVTDTYGESTQDSLEVHTKTEQNEPPAVEEIVLQDDPLYPDTPTEAIVEAYDPYGLNLTYQWEIDGQIWGVEADEQNDELATVIPPDDIDEVTDLTVVVIDEEDESTEYTRQIQTVNNDGPDLDELSVSPNPVAPDETAIATVEGTHPQGFELNYEWKTNDDTWDIVGDTTSEELIPPHQPDADTVLEVTATDAYEGVNTEAIAVETKSNELPVVDSVDSAQGLEPNETVEISVNASDPYDFKLSYEWTIDADGWDIVDGQGTSTLEVKAPDATNSTTEITVTVSDEYGAQIEASSSLETIENQPPVIDQAWANPSGPFEKGESFDVHVNAYDPDGPTVDYEWGSEGDWTFDNSTVSDTTAWAPNHTETEPIVVTVIDEWGDETTAQVDVETYDYEPEEFAFEDVTGVEVADLQVSEPVTITGIDEQISVSADCSGCEVRHVGGTWATELDTVEQSDKLEIRLESAETFNTETTASLRVGETESETWTVETRGWMGEREFTTCGSTGRLGPSQNNCDEAYSSSVLEGEVSVDAGIQRWTVPATGMYEITALGAAGGVVDGSDPGRGARVEGHIYLEHGDELQVLVGQEGEYGSAGWGDASGGGGSFIVVEGEPLFVAGGAGGKRREDIETRHGNDDEFGLDGHRSEAEEDADGATGDGGSPGSGGETSVYSNTELGGGGGGFYDGGAPDEDGKAGDAFVDGGEGGITPNDDQPNGGFGGGGGAHSSGHRTCGGGGGYAGGGGANESTTGSAGRCSGGGGGSFIVGNAENSDRDSADNSGPGEVTIDWVGDE